MIKMSAFKIRMLSLFLSFCSISFLLGGCGTPTGGKNSHGSSDKGGIDHGNEAVSGNGIEPPDTPPAGMRYDEWKGIEYSKDMEFNLRTYWVLRIGDDERDTVFQDNEYIEDAVLKIVDAKAEPVGAEMKLRSGGYVDITIEFEWTGTMLYSVEGFDWYHYFCWMENNPVPFDSCTGTSLLNHSDTDESNSGEIHPGEAMASGMTESDITREGRTYRLFAKSEVRNASSYNDTLELDDNRYQSIYDGDVFTILTFRVPADYEDLAIAIDKDITDERDLRITSDAVFLNAYDTYADILTNDYGKKQTAQDYYFIKVSDILEAFN